MQLSTFAITVPKDSWRLVFFITVLSLTRSTKREAIGTSVTLKVILHSAFSNFQSVCSGVTCTMYGSTCQLLLNKPHNGRLAALSPEVTQAEFVRRELECIIGFDGEEI